MFGVWGLGSRVEAMASACESRTPGLLTSSACTDAGVYEHEGVPQVVGFLCKQDPNEVPLVQGY